MEKDEEIDDMFERLSTIVNNLKILGKSYSNEELVSKMLRSLTRPWSSKVSAIQESKDLSMLSYDRLRGNLIAYELTHFQDELTKLRRKNMAFMT